MLTCHIYYIYGTWRSKELGDLKSSFGGRGRFLWGGGGGKGGGKNSPGTSTTLSELPTYLRLFWSKNSYALRNIPSY